MTSKCLQRIELLKIYHILVGQTRNMYSSQKTQPEYNVPCKFYVCKKETKLPSRVDVKPLLKNEYWLQNVSFFQKLANLTRSHPTSQEFRQSMALLIPKHWSKDRCNKFLPVSKDQPKLGPRFQMPWAKKKTTQAATSMLKLTASKKLPSKSKPKPKPKNKKSIGSRMKSFVIQFIGKSIIAGAVIYATLYFRVWGSIDDSVHLYSKIRSLIFDETYRGAKSRESLDSEPLNSTELRDYVVRKYNANIQWAVCKSIGLPDLAFCYINYYSGLLIDYVKQKYAEIRSGDDDD